MMDLDRIVDEGVIVQKQKMYDDLLPKRDSLTNPKEVLVSYSTDLSYDYQKTLINTMLFKLYMDLNKRSTVYKNDNNYKILVEKIGNIPVPIALTFINDKDSANTIITKTAAVWENNSEVLIEVKIKGNIKAIKLGGDTISDVNSENDIYKFK